MDTTYTNWGMTGNEFEPAEDPDKKCAKICEGDNCPYGKQWRATSCEDKLQFVCTIDCEAWRIKHNRHFSLYSFPDKCPQGWISNDNSCYKLETPLSKRSGPKGAQEYCMNEYKAFAVVPNSVGEAKYLKSYLKEIKVNTT